MFARMPLSARRWAAVIAAVAAVSLVADLADRSLRLDLPLRIAAWEGLRHFTILTSLLITVTMTIIALRPALPDAPWLAALTLGIVSVAGLDHTLLVASSTPTALGGWSDQGLHTAVPVMMGCWWLWHAPKRRLIWADLPIFAMWPAVYATYALARGAQDGIYPYPFIDPVALGSAQVAANLAGIIIAFLLGGIVMVSVGRFADR